MGCTKVSSTDPNRNRKVIDGMFEKGHIKGAAWKRKELCASANECGNFCDQLSLEPGLVPQCICPETLRILSSDLYADYKRRDFKCPDNRF